MILTAHQPHYLPDFRQFSKLFAGDIYLFADHLQYRKQSSVSRALLPGKTPSALSVPIRKSTGKTISGLKTEVHSNWIRKHLKFLELNYKYFPYFEHYFPPLKEIYLQSHSAVSDLWWAIFEWHAGILAPGKNIFRSRVESISDRESLIRWAQSRNVSTMAVFEEELPYYRQNFKSGFRIKIISPPAPPVHFPLPFSDRMALLPLLFYFGPQAGDFFNGTSLN